MSVFDKIKLDPEDALVLLQTMFTLGANWTEIKAELDRVTEENPVLAPARDAIEALYKALTT